MSMEIERKFLVKDVTKINNVTNFNYFTQGYISSNPNSNVRVRINHTTHTAKLTIKGKSFDNGLSKYEWEKDICIEDARELMKLCDGIIIKKTRVYLDRFEIDLFTDEHKGLVIAEIELTSENEEFIKPDWLGEEVTHDHRYHNDYISNNKYPFK